MTSNDRLEVLRTHKHSVGVSRYDQAVRYVPHARHARVFSSDSGVDVTANQQIRSLLTRGISVYASFKSHNPDDVVARARFFSSFQLQPGQFIVDNYYHEPEELAYEPDGYKTWLDRNTQFAEIMHEYSPATLWGVTFTGTPGLELDKSKPERHIYKFIEPGEYEWLDLIGIDRYIHDPIARTPDVAWTKVLKLCGDSYNRPLFIAEFGIEGTAQQRTQWVADHVDYVAQQRRPGNKGKRILGSTWFHSPIGEAAPEVYDGTHTWAINKATDMEDLTTPIAWDRFAELYK